MPRVYKTLLTHPELFWAKVDRSAGIDECWPWVGAKDASGYGRCTKKATTAHRVAYQLAVGPIPHGQFVLHGCDNPPCCNPAHLYAGSAKDNARDMADRGRVRGGGPQRFDREEARRLLGQGLSLRAVGRELGVSHSSIRKALKPW